MKRIKLCLNTWWTDVPLSSLMNRGGCQSADLPLCLHERITWPLGEHFAALEYLLPHAVVSNVSHSFSAIHSPLRPSHSHFFINWAANAPWFPENVSKSHFQITHTLFFLFLHIKTPFALRPVDILPFLSRRGRSEPASLILTLAPFSSSPDKFRAPLGSFPHILVSLTSPPGGGFWTRSKFPSRPCLTFKKGREKKQKHKGSHLKVKRRWTGGGEGSFSARWVKIKSVWRGQILSAAAGLSELKATADTVFRIQFSTTVYIVSSRGCRCAGLEGRGNQMQSCDIQARFWDPF